FFQSSGALLVLPSFPTRRSSDLFFGVIFAFLYFILNAPTSKLYPSYSLHSASSCICPIRKPFVFNSRFSINLNSSIIIYLLQLLSNYDELENLQNWQ